MVTASAEGERATVLTPKLQVPLLPTSAVQRSRLLTAMAADEANGVRVTIVSAPAGSGKTLLLAERTALLRAAGHAVAWVSLAEEDNDPHVLWSSILAALASAVGTADPSTRSALDALSPPARSRCGWFSMMRTSSSVGRHWTACARSCVAGRPRCG